MHKTPAENSPPESRSRQDADQAPLNQHSPGLLSHSDPEPERSAGRAPMWLVIIVVLMVSAFVVLHIAGVFGPGMH